MSLLGDRADMGSPVQQHRTLIANDLQWIDGTLETLGNPHNYLNQEDLDFLTLGESRITPWSFTGLPQSRGSRIIVARDSIQFLVFPGEEAMAQFRRPPRTATLMINLPLGIVRGNAPFLSEAQLHNFLDFWKGLFFPVTDVRIHTLAPSAAELPSQAPLIYINRKAIQSYMGV